MTATAERRYLAAKRRHDTRDRCDCYLDRADDRHQRIALAAFLGR
jgi:hypothetical protein